VRARIVRVKVDNFAVGIDGLIILTAQIEDSANDSVNFE
jgi:hypothetical protein